MRFRACTLAGSIPPSESCSSLSDLGRRFCGTIRPFFKLLQIFVVEIDSLRALQQTDKVVLIALAASVAERLAVSRVGVEEKSERIESFSDAQSN